MPEALGRFADAEQRKETSRIGMWVFLAMEVMFFGGLFTAYASYHYLYPAAFSQASKLMDFWLGSLNTAVLLTSSLTMALSVAAAREGQRERLLRCLFLTMTLGLVFLGIKGMEYAHHIRAHQWPGSGFRVDFQGSGPAEIYFSLYFVMTGLHALHMIIGFGVLTALMFSASRGRFSREYHTPVELAGLYWHFVDIIWIFLFPMFYLVGRH